MTDFPLPSGMFEKHISTLFVKATAKILLLVVLYEIAIMMAMQEFHLDKTLPFGWFMLMDGSALLLLTVVPCFRWIKQLVHDCVDASRDKVSILSDAIKHAGDGIIIADRRGTVTYVNQAFRDVSGCSNADVIGHPVGRIDPVMSGRQWKRRFIQAIKQQGVWHDEQWSHRKSGERYFAKVTVTAIMQGGSNQISHFVTIIQDITDQHELQMQLVQAQKMEAVGTLVGGIAHDFNNMLAAMTGQIYLTNALVKDNAQAVARLGKIKALSDQAADMVRQLLTFARKGSVEKSSVFLSGFIKEASKLAVIGLPANIDYQLTVSPEDMHVCANATQLQQGMMNLINNARDALEGVKNPQICVSLTMRSDEDLKQDGLNPVAGSYAEICVADNGCGIEAKNITKVMEPFFTTKDTGKGTGLGLSMLYGIVEMHQGLMDIRSEPGQGTSFYIFLPLSQADCCTTVKSEVLHQGQGETILLVDDDACVRETGREILESLGYGVMIASNGDDALALYERNSRLIAAVISDVVMPGMQGDELASRIKQHSDSMPVVLMSGYDKNEVLNASIRATVDKVITKPFSVAMISEILQQLLRNKKVTHGSDQASRIKLALQS